MNREGLTEKDRLMQICVDLLQIRRKISKDPSITSMSEKLVNHMISDIINKISVRVSDIELKEKNMVFNFTSPEDKESRE